MMTLYKSLVRSLLEYCCPLWNPQDSRNIQKLENIQSSYISKITGLKDLNYWERLSKLNLDSLQRRRERYCIIHMWKILHNLAPNDLGFDFYHHPRLGFKVQRKPILKPNSKFQTIRDSSFVHIGVRLWNILPKEVSLQSTLGSFKVQLGNFLAKFPDKPSIPGLTYVNNNSLLSFPLFFNWITLFLII